MPIIVHNPGPTFPLRGYAACVDDLTAIANALGCQPATFRYWTDAVGTGAQTASAERLARRDVAGFAVSGEHGEFTVHRRTTLTGQAHTATIETRNNDALQAVLNALTVRRAVWPWHPRPFSFVPRTHAQQVSRFRFILGSVAIPVVLALVGAVIALSV